MNRDFDTEGHVIQVTVEVDLDEICHPFGEGLVATAIISLECPDGLTDDMITYSGKVRGVDAVTEWMYCRQCYDTDDDHTADIRVQNLVYMEGTPGIQIYAIAARDYEENEADYETEEETDDNFERFREELEEDLVGTVTLTVDSHWNCYCKTTRVCGCGCDPLHDGW